MRKQLLFLITALAAMIFITSGCTAKQANTKEKKMEEVEIKEYQGEKLGSSSDFRENSIAGPQHVDIKNYRLEISGLVKNPKKYAYDELLKNYASHKKVTTIHCIEGWSVKILWEGILLKELLKDAAPDSKANTIIFHAYDGYTTSLPLDYIIDKNIMLAYKMNDVTLSPERGFPFQLVAQDKGGYKWVKWVTKIELSDDPNYKGYWEKRGYNQQGDVEGSIWERLRRLP